MDDHEATAPMILMACAGSAVPHVDMLSRNGAFAIGMSPLGGFDDERADHHAVIA